MAYQIWLVSAEEQRNQSILRIDRRRLRDLNDPKQLPEREFIANFRLSKAGFKHVLEEHRPQAQQRAAVRNKLKILAPLNLLTNGMCQRNVGASFRRNIYQPTFTKLREV